MKSKTTPQACFKRTRLTHACLLLACTAPGLAVAQGNSLGTIEVTASPIIGELKLDGFSSVSSLVQEEQLRDLNAVDLASALRRTPGVQISRYNPVGAFGGDQGGAIFIRGLGLSRPGSEIKTYIDDIPFYMGVWNHPLLDLLPVQGVQGITVYKSPQLHINGNNFASLNINSKQGGQKPFEGQAQATLGTYGTFTTQANIRGRQGDVDYSLTQGYARSDGHRPNASGELSQAMGHVRMALNANWSIAGQFVYVDNQAKDPGDNRQAGPAIAPQYNTEAGLMGFTLAHQHGDWQGHLKIYANRGDGNWLNQPAPDGNTLTAFRMSGVRWKETGPIGKNTELVIGLDHELVAGDVQFDRVTPAPDGQFDTPTFKITSPYLAINHTVALGPQWSLVPSVGVRYYDHNNYASKTAPQLGLSLVSDTLTLFANASRGINYPGLETTVLSALIPALGNSAMGLQPETLQHLEVGAKYSPSSRTHIDLSLFDDEIKNRYVFGFPPNVPPPPQFINLGSYRIQGTELTVRHDTQNQWSLLAGLTLLNPSISTLPYTPETGLSLGANGKLGPFKVALDAQYQSDTLTLNRSRNAGSSNTERVGSFTVANARVAYPWRALGPQGEVFVAIENLLDRDYAYRLGYPMPGRSGQVGVLVQF